MKEEVRREDGNEERYNVRRGRGETVRKGGKGKKIMEKI